MKSASACHACGRCSGYRDAVQLGLRSPDYEILSLSNKDVSTEQAFTLIFGVIGIATAAFLWSSSSWFVQIKTMVAELLIERDAYLLLQDNAPWWLLTHWPKANDVFTWLDGLCILGFILVGGLVLGLSILTVLSLVLKLNATPHLSWQRLSLTLVPMGGVGIFLGLSMLTVSHLNAERFAPEILAKILPIIRLLLLVLAMGFSAWLGWHMLKKNDDKSLMRRLSVYGIFLLAPSIISYIWIVVFFL